MIVAFYAPDGPILRHALDLYEKAVEDARKKDERINLPTMPHVTALSAAQHLRETLRIARQDSEDGTLTGDREVSIEESGILRVGCFLVLEKLGKIEEDTEGFEADADGVKRKAGDVRNLVDRLGGQGSFFGPDAGRKKKGEGKGAKGKDDKQSSIFEGGAAPAAAATDAPTEAAADAVARDGAPNGPVTLDPAFGAQPGGALVPVSPVPVDAAADIVDADFEVIDESRRLAAGPRALLTAGVAAGVLDEMGDGERALWAAAGPFAVHLEDDEEGRPLYSIRRIDGEFCSDPATFPMTEEGDARAVAYIATLNRRHAENAAAERADEAPPAHDPALAVPSADAPEGDDAGLTGYDLDAIDEMPGLEASPSDVVAGAGSATALPPIDLNAPLPWETDDAPAGVVSGAECGDASDRSAFARMVDDVADAVATIDAPVGTCTRCGWAEADCLCAEVAERAGQADDPAAPADEEEPAKPRRGGRGRKSSGETGA